MASSKRAASWGSVPGAFMKCGCWPSTSSIRYPESFTFFYDDGEAYRMIGVLEDVTERKESEAALQASESHAQVLLGELQHRVRNTLAVVRSIARRTAELTDGSADFMSHFE